MPRVLHRLLLDVFGRLPRIVRRHLVRWGTPSFTVGALCVIQRDDGRILLIQQRYRRRWGLPGGLLARREHPGDAVRREVREEVGLDVDVASPPLTVVEPVMRRVDIVFLGVPDARADLDELVPSSPEITALRWCALDSLPDVQEETVTALRVLGLVDEDPHVAHHEGPPQTLE